MMPYFTCRVQVAGWPTTFCQERGYPDAVGAAPVVEAGFDQG